MTRRVAKKLATPFDECRATGAVLMVNMVDPQPNTVRVFLEAIGCLPHVVVANKTDVAARDVGGVAEELGLTAIVAASVRTGFGMGDVEKAMRRDLGDRIVILGIFNSGKTSLVARLTGEDLETGDIPGTTLEFTEHPWEGRVLIDTVGQIIDVNRPMMVSVDMDGCRTIEERVARVLRQDAEGILASIDTAVPGMAEAVALIGRQVAAGHKVVAVGAGASALVAMEMGGQGLETGVSVIPMTNNLAQMQPVGFAKGLGEGEMGLARYAASVVEAGDVVVGISASGGTGFVFEAMRLARAKGAFVVAVTENPDTPHGKVAHVVVKSNAKPEGPSSSKVQSAHLAIGHALILTLADVRGVTADASVGFMLPEPTSGNKKMGIK